MRQADGCRSQKSFLGSSGVATELAAFELVSASVAVAIVEEAAGGGGVAAEVGIEGRGVSATRGGSALVRARSTSGRAHHGKQKREAQDEEEALVRDWVPLHEVVVEEGQKAASSPWRLRS